MPQETFAARYRAAERLAGGRCPIEAGLIAASPTTNAATAGSPSTAPRPAAAGPRKAPW